MNIHAQKNKLEKDTLPLSWLLVFSYLAITDHDSFCFMASNQNASTNFLCYSFLLVFPFSCRSPYCRNTSLSAELYPGKPVSSIFNLALVFKAISVVVKWLIIDIRHIDKPTIWIFSFISHKFTYVFNLCCRVCFQLAFFVCLSKISRLSESAAGLKSVFTQFPPEARYFCLASVAAHAPVYGAVLAGYQHQSDI